MKINDRRKIKIEFPILKRERENDSNSLTSGTSLAENVAGVDHTEEIQAAHTNFGATSNGSNPLAENDSNPLAEGTQLAENVAGVNHTEESQAAQPNFGATSNSSNPLAEGTSLAPDSSNPLAEDTQLAENGLTPLAPDGYSLLQGEKYEDLQYADLAIIQHADGYRFTSDAVLLANSVHNAKGKQVMELCGGSGIIAILLAAKCAPQHIDVCELQPRLASMAARSVLRCRLQTLIDVYCADARGIAQRIKKKYDVVVCNPPYRKAASGAPPLNSENAIAKQEICLTLKQVVDESASLLNDKGSLYIVHQVERLAEFCTLCAKADMQVKELTFIRPRQGEQPNLFIARAVKAGKTGLKILPDIVIFDEKGNYTVTVKALYS